MANNKKQKIPYAEMNEERVNVLLKRDPANVKAVIANTIETKKIAQMLPAIDTIFNNARRNVGYSVSIEDFTTMVEQYKEVVEKMENIISKAEELKIYKPYKRKDTSKDSNKEEITTNDDDTNFTKHKEVIITMLDNGKTQKEISESIGENIKSTRAFINKIKTEAEDN